VKHLDELAFQMNLLRFLSGIEVARTGNADAFVAIQDELTSLSDSLQKHHGTIVGLLSDLSFLLSADISRESIDRVKSAVEMVRKAADMGNSLSAKIMELAMNIGERGVGFACIGAVLEKQTRAVAEIAELLDRSVAETEKPESSESAVLSKADADTSIKTIRDIAFLVNVTAFNAAVETARSADRSELLECVDRIREYASRLHQTGVSIAEANMPHGIPMLYIAREFDVFIKKIHKVLEKSNLCFQRTPRWS